MKVVIERINDILYIYNEENHACLGNVNIECLPNVSIEVGQSKKYSLDNNGVYTEIKEYKTQDIVIKIFRTDGSEQAQKFARDNFHPMAGNCSSGAYYVSITSPYTNYPMVSAAQYNDLYDVIQRQISSLLGYMK